MQPTIYAMATMVNLQDVHAWLLTLARRMYMRVAQACAHYGLLAAASYT